MRICGAFLWSFGHCGLRCDSLLFGNLRFGLEIPFEIGGLLGFSFSNLLLFRTAEEEAHGANKEVENCD